MKPCCSFHTLLKYFPKTSDFLAKYPVSSCTSSTFYKILEDQHNSVKFFATLQRGWHFFPVSNNMLPISICLHCGRLGFDSFVGKIPWRSKWLPTPVFLPGEFYGQRNLVGCKESDTTEQLILYFHVRSHQYGPLWHTLLPTFCLWLLHNCCFWEDWVFSTAHLFLSELLPESLLPVCSKFIAK